MGRALALAAVAVLALGCGAAPPPPEVPPARAAETRPVADAALPDAGWGEVGSTRFSVSLPLPDVGAWRVDDRTGRWLVAVHLPSKSMLLVRSFREGALVGHRQCEAEGRKLRPDLFGRDEDALTDRRPLRVPDGYDTEVGFLVRRNGGALGGVAVAAGGRVRQCLLMAYATRAEGPAAARVIADRLAFVTERIFARVAERRIDDRVAPEPPR